ncbi:hypothetical protein DN062_09620 [Nitrincola tibetensis]|uniref:Peptidase M48 domain-containing protein n=1 Tax=Nitrincola tibetensis TaxID=2219697 RepID=A0A364NLQ2_9GAMM|nr:M48 family metallopeptidase [Nitrincola tibetensis]RAU18038.1 hypothetical protein DN062_09620 [Nitrincola tibetensis]
MNFFEHQERAKRKTLQLVFLFALGVGSLIISLTLVIGLLMYFAEGGTGEVLSQATNNPSALPSLLSPENLQLLITLTVAVIGVILLGSLFRRAQLTKGGQAIAEAMGGRLLNTATLNTEEERILNIVEEMALASGIPVPPVYLIEDDAINAFAAGYRPQDAVIGITRGSIQLLTRDELQGVVAHEFSHILHGDMRLNIRLISMLYGILLIGMIGRFIVRSLRYRPIARTSNKNNSVAFLMVLGLGLMIVGFAGSFFGNLIKAAVSRQREFLADASAVQYTRNPLGISGALKKIGGHVSGSSFNNPRAEEFSHMFFSQHLSNGFSDWFSTHPPLEDRIKRVEPRWKGSFTTPTHIITDDTRPASTFTTTGFVSTAKPQNFSAQIALNQAMAGMADPTPEHLAYARRILDTFDSDLLSAAHEPFSARALIYGLLMSQDKRIQEQQLDQLRKEAHPDTFKALEAYLPKLLSLTAEFRLPLVEISLPALKQLSDEQYETFKTCLELLIAADNRTSLFEWSIKTIVTRHIRGVPRSAKRYLPTETRAEISRLVCLIANVGHKNDEDAEAAFHQAMQSLNFPMRYQPDARPKIKQLESDLEKLSHLRPLDKPAILRALVICASHDDVITTAEAELLRAIAECLDCPLPPLLI